MKSFNRIFFALSASLLSFCAFAQQYQASFTDSQWEFTGNRVACAIKHTIPQYGSGIFEQKAGERVSFVLTAKSYVPPIQTAMLSSVAPAWMHNESSLKLATIKTKSQQVVVSSDVAERMLQELSSGRFSQFSYQPKLVKGKVNVVVSSVNFLDAMIQFESCRQGLLPFSRQDVHHQLSLFNNLGTEITHRNRKLLSKAVTYVKEAGDEERIDLVRGTDGFSVKDGRRFYDKRVKKIREFLIGEGMPEEQVIALDDPEALDTPKGSVRIKIAGPEPFKHIYFRSGSVSLNKRDNIKLDYLLEYMRLQKPEGTLVLKGYSDSEGPRHVNMLMSKKRIKIIKQYLLSKGIEESRITTKAYGESKPTATNRYPTGRQLNRRVDISISG
ncbi:MAG: phosphate ABC transporter substrate-binding protein [Cycloclasticus sp. symbiont of Bathymodiolus heckerae]|nr:MAG: phosphate ABC transporter substrate-binding protein [Cycloclasticus sp. symbiont of Bathymodiolus heckerae]